jgi:hypothetical protein
MVGAAVHSSLRRQTPEKTWTQLYGEGDGYGVGNGQEEVCEEHRRRWQGLYFARYVWFGIIATEKVGTTT